jgi:peptidoglycan/xylan/chitin deacetylase (PgdA/CDA1 family)
MPLWGGSFLTVLVYHKVEPNPKDVWTVSPDDLDAQLEILSAAPYSPIHPTQLLQHLRFGTPLPKQAVLVTFDDGYVSNAEHALPLLKKHSLTALMFLPTAYLGGVNEWDGGQTPILSAEELRAIDSTHVCFGLHSHRHTMYRDMELSDIVADVQQGQATFAEQNIPFLPMLAYPYGRDPRGKTKAAASNAFKALGIACAFRLGNHANRLPLRKPFAIQRIDVRRDDGRDGFARKLRIGPRWFG